MGIFLLFGFYSLLAQVLLLREVAQLFTAHELSLAAALAAWLLWTAALAAGMHVVDRFISIGPGLTARAARKPAFLSARRS